MAGAIEGTYFVGKKVEELRALLKINYPIEHGVVTDWNDMEKIWSHIYTEELKTVPEEHPVLLTEAPLNPDKTREAAAQILFETFNVPALYFSIQAVLSLYASGRTTGLVLDSGDGVTHAVPVYEGFTIPSAIQRIDLAGRDVTMYLKSLLRKSGLRFETTAEDEIVRVIKEKTCYVALDSTKEEENMRNSLYSTVQLGSLSSKSSQPQSNLPSTPETFLLPDGNRVKLGHERFKAPEILFRPDLAGLEYPGLHQLIADCIAKSDCDLRKTLYANIIFSGGTTLTQGFGDRMLYELRRTLIPDSKIKIYAPPERKYSTWIGGSILAGLSSFKKMWVSSEEYQEDPNIIFKKLF
ncbi:Actin-2 [Zancudomyces culisetae]|uniref:Centractin n=1 Tax=Zancudomyces culisetae TaxID=1213189 RepID=A0A1R1PK13_ZANCU|nr:Actin-2 [Zancudomyces culisetae]|eukprot:OMH81305.1 Actin-2 [Zancudomyces culisetae]